MSLTLREEIPVNLPHVPLPRVIALHFIVFILIAVAGGYGMWLVAFGDAVATSPTYTILRTIPGGMRTWGVCLVTGAVLMAWAVGRDTRGHPRALNIVLAGGVFYYVLWSLILIRTWQELQAVPAAGALVYNAAFAVIYYGCARASAPAASRTKQAVESAGDRSECPGADSEG